MPYLTHELLKNCTTLWRLDNISSLCSSLCDTDSDVYGLKAEFGFPQHLIPKDTNNYIAHLEQRAMLNAFDIKDMYEKDFPNYTFSNDMLNYRKLI